MRCERIRGTGSFTIDRPLLSSSSSDRSGSLVATVRNPQGLTSVVEPPAFRLAFPLSLGLALVVGVVLRAVPVLTADFPLTDGGLFLLMIEAVRGSHFALPVTVTYNGMDLP